MIKTITEHGGKIDHDFHAEVKTFVKPVIVAERNGFLVDDKGKLHVPEVFNRIWNCTKTKMFGKFHKGKNPDGRRSGLEK